MSSPVPNFPPLSGIADPNTRAALQALYDNFRVRNGESGTGEHRFIEARELGVAGAQAKAALNWNSSTIFGGSGGTVSAPGLLSVIVQKVVDNVTESALWKSLSERLTWIDTPEWFAGKFGAAIRTEQLTRQSADSALAQQTTTAVTNINGNIALVRQELTATSNLAKATASAVTQVQVQVGQVQSIAQQALGTAVTTEGEVSSTWSVKFDVNGYVCGAGLGLSGKGGAYTSQFLVRADSFAIGSPQAPGIAPVVPFIVRTTPATVDGQTLPAGVYMSSNVFLTGDLFVAGTIHAAQLNNSNVQVASGTTSASINVPAGQRATILCFGQANFLSSGGGAYDIQVSINGAGYSAISQQGGYSAAINTSAAFTVIGPATFIANLNYGFAAHTGTGSWNDLGIFALAFFTGA